MHDEPLVVPAHDPLRRLERGLAALAQRRVGRDQVEHLVVELQHGQLQLADEGVLVVARVAQQRRLLVVARQVVLVVVPADQHLLAAGVAVVEERVVGRPPAVHAVQVEARAAEVRQRVRVVRPGQAGDRVEGQVVVDELAQVRVAGRDVRVVQLRRRTGHVLRHQRRDLGDPRVAGHERRQPEHPAEPALVQPRQRQVRQAALLVAVPARRAPGVPQVVPAARRRHQLLRRPRCRLAVGRCRRPLHDVGHPTLPVSSDRHGLATGHCDRLDGRPFVPSLSALSARRCPSGQPPVPLGATPGRGYARPHEQRRPARAG